MLNSYYRLSVPEDLTAYYHVTDVINSVEESPSEEIFASDLTINRDARGCVTSVNYYSPDKELVKEVFYTGETISKINYYRGKYLVCTEGYKNGLLALKFVFKNSGYLAYSVEYEYNRRNFVTGICKKYLGRILKAEYKYDDIDRIVERIVYNNDEEVIKQIYNYDILDRIVEYKDNNQRIVVNKVSKKNELLYYVITDRMGNDITIENLFTERGYAYTNITLNGHSSTVKDTSFVDNVMLKKPYTSEDDLDLIIANLFRREDAMHVERENIPEKRSSGLIDKSIEFRALPISMRKRLLYSIAAKALWVFIKPDVFTSGFIILQNKKNIV